VSARDWPIDLLADLVGVARGGEEATQEWVAGRLTELGCEVDTFRYAPAALSTDHAFAITIPSAERVCVVGRLRGRATGPGLMLFTHPDCEPAETIGATSRWRARGAVREGRLSGPGVADDLAGVAAMIAAVRAVRECGGSPPRCLLVASVPSKATRSQHRRRARPGSSR
jgi:acetylornithine deacetylase